MAATAVRLPRVGTARAERFAADVRDYLSRTPKQLPSQYFYDAIGSALFAAICELPWYGITRAETRLLSQYGGDILDRVRNLHAVAELGPGNGTKLAALLVARPGIAQHVRVDLIDISRAALDTATATLATHGVLRVVGHETTYDDGLARLARVPATGARLILFLGSNLGNFEPAAADAMLRRIWQGSRPGDALLLGVDLVKPEGDLILAYDDPIGVTAAFNRNLIARINRELGATFAVEAFAHRALWNAEARRVEMHLVSTRAQTVRVPPAGLEVSLAAGESIWTESSCKYEPDDLGPLLARAGFVSAARWIDSRAQFALVLGFRPLDNARPGPTSCP